MNVLFLINEFERNGAERVVSYLLNHISTTIPESKLYLYLLEESEIGYTIPYSVEISFGSKYHSNGIIKLLKIFLLAFRIKKFVKKNNIEIVMSFLSRSNYVNILSKMAGSPHRAIISERHTPSQKYKKKDLKNWINRQLINILYPRCKEIMAVSRGVKNDLETNFNIPVKNISVIYNPYPIEKIMNEAKQPCNHKWLSDSQIKSIVTLGRLEEPKNHYLLVKAFQIVAENIPEARLIIVGDGSQRDALNQLIQKLDIESKVDMVGKKENPFPYLAKADLFVLSSDTEGFPNVLVESIICGCPVISTDCPSGPNEIINSGENGYLVPVNDVDDMSQSILSLLRNDNLRARIADKASRSIQYLDIENVLDQYVKILQHENKFD